VRRAELLSLLVALCVEPPALARGYGGPAPDRGNALLLDVGHTAAITSLALSPDGTELASSSLDGRVRLFDARTGKVRAELPVAAEVFSVAFSPDGKQIATGSTYNLVKLWDARTAEPLATYQDNREWVTSVAFSPDGRLLASCDEAKGIVIRDLARGAVVATPPFKGLRRLVWRPDGRSLAVFGADFFGVFDLAAWETPDGGPRGNPSFISRISVPPFSTSDVSWSRTKDAFVFGEYDVSVSDLGRDAPHQIAPRLALSSLAFSPDGNRLAIGTRDGAVEIRDASLEKTIARLVVAKTAVTSLLWSADGERLYVGDAAGAVSSWLLGKGERAFDKPGQPPRAGHVSWGPKGRLATETAVWDLAGGSVVARFDSPFWGIDWCGDVLVGIGPKGLVWHDGATGSVLASAPAFTRASTVTCSPDGRETLAYGDGVEVWDNARHTGRKIKDAWVGSAAWGPGDCVALGFEHSFERWRLSARRPVRELSRGGGARAIAWRRDGTIAADIGATHRINANWQEIGLVSLRAETLSAGKWLASCLPDSLDHCAYDMAAWSPDGNRLAFIVDHVLDVIDTRGNPTAAAEPAASAHHVSFDMAWSPDGLTIASADNLGVLLIRVRDGATMRLREVWTRDRILGLVDDEHGRYGGDADATSRVVGVTRSLKEAPAGSQPAATKPALTLVPDLLARFLEAVPR
jgi:WD40 repeat protein